MANIPTARNNPGDTKVNGKIATYNSPVEGKAALYNDLTTYMHNNPQYTLYDFSKKYAPDSDGNNSAQYAANLANQLKVTPDTTIGTLAPRIDDFAGAIEKNEGYQDPSQGEVAGDTAPSNSSGIPITPLQIPPTVQQQIQSSKSGGSTFPGLLTQAAQGVTDTLGLHGAVDTVGGELAPILNATDPNSSFKQKIETSKYLTPPNPLEAAKAGAQIGAATAVPEGIGEGAAVAKPAIEDLIAKYPKTAKVAGLLALNKLRQTKLGDAIENILGIKGVLGL